MFEMQIAELRAQIAKLRPRTERRRHDGDAAVREKTQEIEPLSEEKIERLRTPSAISDDGGNSRANLRNTLAE